MAQTTIEKKDTELFVKPEDRLDTATAPKFRDEVMPCLEGVNNISMDFCQVEYISSAGLRVLLELYQEMEDRGGSLKLRNVRSSIMTIFNLVNFTEIVEVE